MKGVFSAAHLLLLIGYLGCHLIVFSFPLSWHHLDPPDNEYTYMYPYESMYSEKSSLQDFHRYEVELFMQSEVCHRDAYFLLHVYTRIWLNACKTVLADFQMYYGTFRDFLVL
jgi:hypothetical protein